MPDPKKPGVETRPVSWIHDHDRPLLYFPLVPEAFVKLGHDAFGEVADDGKVKVTQPLAGAMEFADGIQRNSITLLISREEAIGYGLIEPTDEERAAIAARSEAFRVKRLEERAQPGPPVTLEAVLELIGWPADFAEHLLHPACTCMVTLTDDPFLCSWATELGWVWDDGQGMVVRRG